MMPPLRTSLTSFTAPSAALKLTILVICDSSDFQKRMTAPINGTNGVANTPIRFDRQAE
jgi:hypothetical protein